MNRFPLTLPPIDEIRLEDCSELRVPIPVRSLHWRWFAFPATGEVFYAAVVHKDFRLSLPGAKAEGEAGDYVALTLHEVFIIHRAEILAAAVQLMPLIAQCQRPPPIKD